MIKKGAIFHSLYVDNDTLQHSWSTYVVRTIRGGKITAIEKNSCTWGKRSKKQGDYGWLENIDDMFRETWKVGDELPHAFSTTRLGEIRKAVKSHERYVKMKFYSSQDDIKNMDKKLARLKATEKRSKK